MMTNNKSLIRWRLQSEWGCCFQQTVTPAACCAAGTASTVSSAAHQSPLPFQTRALRWATSLQWPRDSNGWLAGDLFSSRNAFGPPLCILRHQIPCDQLVVAILVVCCADIINNGCSPWQLPEFGHPPAEHSAQQQPEGFSASHMPCDCPCAGRFVCLQARKGADEAGELPETECYRKLSAVKAPSTPQSCSGHLIQNPPLNETPAELCGVCVWLIEPPTCVHAKRGAARSLDAEAHGKRLI